VTVANVLSIAGSDPSGGAGVQADLKTFAALGVYGTAVITALTVQNTHGVTAVEPVRPALVAQQIRAVIEDVHIGAIKIGMLATAEIVAAVADVLDSSSVENVVLDPVITSSSGHPLLSVAGVGQLRERLLPRCSLLTPNLDEAGILLGRAAPSTIDEMRDAARALVVLGARAVYLKGGHLGGATSPDLLFDGEQMVELSSARIDTRNTHGSGCALSSAIAAHLALGRNAQEAVRRAKQFVNGAIGSAASLEVGSGSGPLHHAHPSHRLGRLYLVATPRPSMSDDEFLARVGAALDGGVDVLQLRCKNAEALWYIRLAERVQLLTRAAGVPFVINDRPDVAVAIGADGVHLGQQDLPPAVARELLAPNSIIGRSSHAPADAQRALDEGATYFAVGPVWETPTKPGRPAAGLSYVRQVSSRDVAVPWYAIGGITLENVAEVRAAGATRIAVVRAVLDAADPARAAAELAEAMS
jgi:hydroxymethylpyrimidine kinase/phosphomethylpyrimidine kinase/thiamine-phosphate diphosphorylase